MTKELNQRQKYLFTIEHNGIAYCLGSIVPGSAMKKAHQLVRRYVLREWLRISTNIETTAVVMADGVRYRSVYGIHKNRSIQSVTLS